MTDSEIAVQMMAHAGILKSVLISTQQENMG